jgi:hypothetical protein
VTGSVPRSCPQEVPRALTRRRRGRAASRSPRSGRPTDGPARGR